jgi:hypothetical protein
VQFEHADVGVLDAFELGVPYPGFVVGPERRVPRSALTQWADDENAGERPVRLDPPTDRAP